MLLCGFALVLFYLILRCPLFRVEPICFVMFFRTIKIPARLRTIKIHHLMNCTLLLTLTGLRQRLPDPLPALPPHLRDLRRV